MITLNGSFYLFNAITQNYMVQNLTGRTILNGCTESLTTKTQQLQSDNLSGSTYLLTPFWQTITPLIFFIAVSVILAYVLFLVSFLASSRRPWLQRAAALSAVVSLTLAADLMWNELERQQNSGTLYNADDLRAIRTNTALKILRIISNSTLWLAEVQVLIRLFPRHRDKVIIKWTGLFMIVVETVFAVLNDLVHPSRYNPKSTNALVPAFTVIAYVFHIALDVLYAICVLFYTASSGRWRYAYSLDNIPIAVVSIVVIVSPVTFFCLDIWNSSVDGWGDYIRWVSTVAATVIVWDWIDKIELCITKNSKAGVLGREVFEDEMQDGKNKKANHSDSRGNQTAKRLKKSWMMRKTTSRVDVHSEVGIELPIIHHPLAKSSNFAKSSNSAISTRVFDSTRAASRSISTTAETARSHQQEVTEEPALERTTYLGHGSRILEEQGRVHERFTPIPGFRAGDYWQDEKTEPDV